MRETQLQQAKIKVKIVLLGIIFLVLLILGGQFMSRQQYQPVDASDKTTIEINIPEGTSAGQVAALLKSRDLIRSEKAFLKYCLQENLDAKLKAGSFSLSRSMSVKEISSELVKGQHLKNSITIPEGYTVKEIGQLFQEKRNISPENWQKALQDDYDYAFLPPKDRANRLEGYLYPDTYVFAEQADAHAIIAQMLDNFQSHWDKEFAGLIKGKNLDPHDVVIIASLIEREAQQADERKRIAGVIYNRLAINMPLQIDATVLYSLGKHKDTVEYADLKVDSPYNTYVYPGLPVGPISCPGSASLAAALQPEKNDYFYYVSRGDGSHQFSKTFAEHQAAINKYSK
jgi:UPF0755 protein